MNTKKQRNWIEDKLDVWGMYDWEYALDVIIQKLQNIQTNNPGYNSIRIDVDQGYEESPEFTFYGKRDENEEELIRRLEKEAKDKENANRAKEVYRKVMEKKERELYEQLKNKFEC